jgi:elongation factor 1-alpha
MAEKPHLNLVFIGHVDHGKSTLVGRLLLDTGHIEQHIIDKFRKEAEEKGKATFEFAWAMDHLKEERERGLTIDVAHRRFDTDKYYFTIIDAPGHRDFVKNMITGTSQADAAVLLVEAPAGVMAQTKEHVWLSKTLGVEQMIIAINKMDATKPPWDENRYNEVVEQISGLLKTVGYKTDEMLFVPVSAFTGDNAVEKSDNMPWWKGPTMLGALDTITEPKKPTDLPLRWPVQDVYTITGIGTVPVGRVETGVITPDIKIIFQPSDKVGEVKSIEMHHEQIPKAEPGDNVGINIRGIAKNDIRRGDVAGPVDNPPSVAKSFTAQIAVLNHPSVLTEGYTPVFHTHTAQVACTFEEIQKKLNPKDASVLEERSDEKPILLTTGDAAIVKIRPTKPMVIEKHAEFPQLGRFAVRDMGQTVAAGVVLDVEKR